MINNGIAMLDLTLTRVVFEYKGKKGLNGTSSTFNFNKSCIWIWLGTKYHDIWRDLTLTRVVFEFLCRVYIIYTL